MEIVRKRILVTGRVQGVGFRWFASRAAEGLGLSGWVRNLPDGSVLCEAQGPPGAVDALAAALRSGPEHALVDDVTVEPVAVSREAGAFRVVY